MSRWVAGAVAIVCSVSIIGFFLAVPAHADESASSPAVPATEAALKAVPCPVVAGNSEGCIAEHAAASIETVDKGMLKPIVEANIVFALFDFMSFVLDRLAYESALFVASGGKGDQPLYHVFDPLDSGNNPIGLDIVGGSMDFLNTGFGELTGFKFDICNPGLLTDGFKLALSLGIKASYTVQKPKCDFLSIGKNWNSFLSSAAELAKDPTGPVLAAFAQGLRPGQNELSMSIDLAFSTREEYNKKRTLDLLDREFNGGFKDVTDVVTGQIKTPAVLLREDFLHANVGKDEKKQERVAALIAANPQFWWGMLWHTVGVFTSTLGSKWTQQLYEGFFPAPELPSNPFDSLAVVSNAREQAQEHFSKLIAVTPTSVDNYNILGEFITCPTGGVVMRGPNHCVIDQPFFQAVSRGATDNPLTVAQAIEERFIHKDWPLVRPDDPKNQDILCKDSAYCFGNLVKLRKARILPIGWEMAAGKVKPNETVKLEDVIAGFDDCNAAGTADDMHRWCHLIDPNWILKYPDTQCRAFVNGETLAAANSGARAPVCADTPSCLSENADGECTGGFGYCVREKNVWQFRGDACPADFAGCLALQNTQTNQRNGFLLNTVDFAGCNSGNAGCLWSRVNKFPDTHGTASDTADDTFEFLPAGQTYVVAAKDAAQDAFRDRAYFNNDVKSCNGNDAGCAGLLRAENVTFNLLQNGSFERGTAGSPPVVEGWQLGSAVTYSDALGADQGSDAVGIGSGTNGTISQSGVFLSKDSFYTLSFEAKGSGTAVGTVTLTTLAGVAIDLTNVSTRGCAVIGAAAPRNQVQAAPNLSAAYAATTCTFSLPANALASVSFSAPSGATLDSVQLERGENATPFTDGYAGNVDAAVASLKVPPSYLDCRGLPTDPKECAGFAPVCAAVDVGCERYRPEDGDPSVSAVASDIDRCPAACVGYAAFKQEETKYEASAFPVNFIPTTAQACSEANVGCDAFTNLDTLAAGGEAVEHYTDLRACTTPVQAGADRVTYFTWTGTQAQGFQLRPTQLLKSNRDDAPCTATVMDDPNSIRCDDADPATRADAACDEHSDTITDLDCGEFYDGDGDIHYRRFSETVFVDESCHPYRKTQLVSDPAAARDTCFVTGGFFTASGECHYFGLPSRSRSCPASAAGCRAYTGGGGRNVATVLEETFEENGATDWTAQGSATVAVSNDAVSAGGHSLRVSNAAAGAGASTLEGSVSPFVGNVVPGRTFTVSFFARGTGDVNVAFRPVDGTPSPISDVPADLTTDWRPYSLGPIDSSTIDGFDDQSALQFTAVSGGTEFFLDNVRVTMADDTLALIKDSWVTPASCDTAPNGQNAPQFYLGCEAYTDRAGATDEFYRFGRLCSEQAVGCEAFFDTHASESEYGQTFNARCVATGGAAVSVLTPCAVQGRTACQIAPGKRFCLFDADGVIPPGTPNVTMGPEARVVYNDSPLYLVDDGSDQCSVAAVGCTEVGTPKFNQDKTAVTSFTSAFVIDDPDTYDQVLCGHEDLFCQEFSSTKDGNFYFKDPLDQRCEFKTDIRVGGQNASGWFVKGTIVPCDEDVVISGNTFGIRRNGDAGYEGWVGECGSQYDLCTAFVDPSDTDHGAYPQGVQYTFLDNDALSDTATGSERCEGQVSQKLGCAVFRNVTDPSLKFASGPSYVASEHADVLFGGRPFDLRDPVSCPATSAGYDLANLAGLPDPQALCSRRCRYPVGADRDLAVGNSDTSTADAAAEYAGSCLVDSDCPSLEDDRGDAVSGTCVDLRTGKGSDGTAVAAVSIDAAFKNDANDVIKVNRNRDCAEWLQCASSHASWDPNTSTFRTICDGLALCETRGQGTGDNACAGFVDPQPITLDEAVYTSRDVSWNGLEYSGYAIPNQLSMDLLSQVNVNPGRWCVDADGNPAQGSAPSVNINIPNRGVNLNPILDLGVTLPGTIVGREIACASDDDCASDATCEDAPEDFRLAYVAGSCQEAGTGGVGRGGSCAVGFCKNSNAGCVTDNDCSSSVSDDTCVFGFCQATNNAGCVTDADCTASGFRICDDLKCVDQLKTLDDTCSPDGSVACSGTQQCISSAKAKLGACYNDSCLTDVSGIAKLQLTTAESTACRAYPEPTSPFDAGKIVSVHSPDINAGDSEHLQPPTPVTFIPQFSGSNTCAPVASGSGWATSDDCLCSYQKVTYGDGAITRYYGTDRADAPPTGVCTNPEKKGMECEYDADCDSGTPPTSENPVSAGFRPGSCSKRTAEDTLLGWEGYCLERDSSFQLFGSQDPSDRSCLTWLPVDQLSGATDLFGKSIEAGFERPADATGEIYYCAETAVYADLWPLGVQLDSTTGLPTSPDPDTRSVDYACAASDAEAGPGGYCDFGSYGEKNDSHSPQKNNDDTGCIRNAFCPDGYVAMLGYCDSDEKGNGGSSDETKDKGTFCKAGNNASDFDQPRIPDPLAVSETRPTDDCPYICIPQNSHHAAGANPGEDCLAHYSKLGTSVFETPVYGLGDIANGPGSVSDFQYLADCSVRGVPMTPGTGYDPIWIRTFDGMPGRGWGPGGYGWVQTDNGTPKDDNNNDERLQNDPQGSYGIAHRAPGAKVKHCDLTGKRCAVKDDCRIEGTGAATDNLADCLASCASNPAAYVVGGTSFGICMTICLGSSAVDDLSDANECVSDGPFVTGSVYPYYACQELVQVTGTGSKGLDNKAQTDNLWSDSGFTSSYAYGGQAFPYGPETIPTPAGRALLDEMFVRDPDTGEFAMARNVVGSDSWPLPVCADDDGAGTGGGIGTIGLNVGDETALADACSAGARTYPGEGEYAQGPALKEGMLPFALARPFEDLDAVDGSGDERKAVNGEVSATLAGLAAVGSSDPAAPTPDNGLTGFGVSVQSGISRFFTKVFNRFQYDFEDDPDGETGGAYVPTSDDLDLSNKSGTVPVVTSVEKCEGSTCEEGSPGTFTVNELAGGNVKGIDGRQHVAVSFYTYANSNQMPIKNIVVDWGDGHPGPGNGPADWPTDSQSGSTDDGNFYKNHRGATRDGEPICGGSSPANFGLTPRACDSTYRSYSHDYRCSATLVADLETAGRTCRIDPDNGRLLNAPCTGGQVPEAGGACVFQPRVFVKDNWGYCTGVCPGGVDASDKCYDGESQGGLSQNECRPLQCPGGTGCPDDNPWVNYNGYVIVQP